MYLFGIPLLIIPFAIYNMIAFLTPGVSWTGTVATVSMVSGAAWTISPHDILIAVSVLLLFGEIFKAARSSSSRSIIDHMLSMVLFIIMLIEFLLVKQAATSTFFLLMVLSLVDVIGGFASTARAARRDVAVEETTNL